MASFFGFSSSSSAAKLAPTKPEDLPVEVTITPTAGAFYAGETFSVGIAFSCSRRPGATHAAFQPNSPLVGGSSSADNFKTPTSATRTLDPSSQLVEPSQLPTRKRQIGLAIDTPPESYNAKAGPSRLTTPRVHPSGGGYTDSPAVYADSPYSPGANPARGGWLISGSPMRDGLGMRSPEGARRYSGKTGQERRTQSLAMGKGMSPQEMVWALGGQPPPPLPSRRPPGETRIPSSHPHSRKISVTTQPRPNSPSAGIIDLSDDHLATIPESASTTEMNGRSRPQLSRITSASSASSSATASYVDIGDDTPRYRPCSDRRILSPPLTHRSPPPSHPYIRSLAEPRETTILWAHTRIVAHFHPSNAYIPPDPLLPLRSLLLHQPIGAGSGALTSSQSAAGGSRWQLSFGTGTIGHETKPSLTGSLVGLASSLVYGGSAGTLEEDRKKAWNTKDLPVLETARSLLGVDIRLKEGEKREYTYSFPIPRDLPPTHRGRAFAFGWSLVLSMAVGNGGSREIEVPIRVWNHVALGSAPQPYNVLSPIIQTRDEGTVVEVKPLSAPSASLSSPQPAAKSGDTKASLDAYAQQLLNTSHSTPKAAPPSPGRKLASARPASPSRSTRPEEDGASVPLGNGALDIPDSGTLRAGRGRKGSFIQGDEELVEEGGDGHGCDQAVEILSRHSTKASYDIAKDGDLVSVFTLLKTTHRLGETILGVITINPPPHPSPTRRVLRFSAYLESNDLIPTSLLPPSARGGVSAQPALVRTHADFNAGYVNHTGRLAFNLDIPSDGTPGFAFGAAAEEGDGGVEWRIRLAFLVTSPSRHGERGGEARSVLVSANEGDNRFYEATNSLAPIEVDVGGAGREVMEEQMGTETVECEIPIKVLPGNTALKVRPLVYII